MLKVSHFGITGDYSCHMVRRRRGADNRARRSGTSLARPAPDHVVAHALGYVVFSSTEITSSPLTMPSGRLTSTR